MMNVGIDIIEVERIREKMKNPKLMERVYSKAEIELFERKKFNAETMAGRFCVKEAFGKSLGTGILHFELDEVTTLNDEKGAPYIIVEGGAKEALGDRKISVSISHTKEYATAVVIIY